MICVYADETGTCGIQHKTGKEPAPGVYGYLATPKMWEAFQDDWKATLVKYEVPYFHFRELNRAGRTKPKSPYHGWSDERVDDFIHEMAIVASRGPIPFGGNASVLMLPERSLDEIYAGALRRFFCDFTDQMNEHFPEEKGRASFFFSQIGDANWKSILVKELTSAKITDRRIGEYFFVDHKDDSGIPCQAADLFAYVNRQITETMYQARRPVPQRILDIVISRHAYPKGHPFKVLSTLEEGVWEGLIKEMRDQKRNMEITRRIVGDPP
jgi:hypothetical protein